MANIQLTLAINDYDHVRDFVQGEVKAKGIDIIALKMEVEEIFHRFTLFREWDISEMSMGKYVSLKSQDDDSLSAIPVFPSRVFRHSMIYVSSDGPVKKPEDLAGKKVGVPEWAQTATIYARGYLMHQVGIPLADIEWFQAGVNQPGRMEHVKLKLPEGVRYTSVPKRSLSEMLLCGDLDAVLSARPVAPFTEGDPRVRRLFPDYRSAEAKYYQETGIFPIMHLIALRKDVLDAHPWVAVNLFNAFVEAKENGLARAKDITVARYPLPWVSDLAEQARRLFGDDLWPYGIEPNRRTLEAFLQYAFEQGVCHRQLEVEEMFTREVQNLFRV